MRTQHQQPHQVLRDIIHNKQHFVAESPLTNLIKGEDSYTLSVSAPGLTKKDFHISLEEYVITIKADTDQNDRESIRREEYNYSKFTKKIKLPKDVNKESIKATYKQGILTLVLGKLSEDKIHKTITIS
jgi:HSP20 family protein